MVSGVGLGAANSLSNVFGSSSSPASLSPDGVFPLEVLASVLGTPWVWAVVAFLAGFVALHTLAGPVVGVLSLLVADVTYYLSDSVTGYASFSSPELLYWGALAVPTGLVMGLCGSLTAQRRWWCILPGMAAPVAIVVLARPSGFGAHPAVADGPHVGYRAVALGVAVVAVWVWGLYRRRRSLSS